MDIALVEQEISSYSWHNYQDIAGRAEQVPDALRELLHAQDAQHAEVAYWKLENRVVVQGQLFEVAEIVVPVLLAILSTQLPSFIKISVLELLFQIVRGIPHEAEVLRGQLDLTERCKQKAREGLWLFYRELRGPHWEACLEILMEIETNQKRILDTAPIVTFLHRASK